VHGKKDGQLTCYYPDGKIYFIKNYKHGAYHGKFISYNSYGEPYGESNWENNIKIS